MADAERAPDFVAHAMAAGNRALVRESEEHLAAGRHAEAFAAEEAADLLREECDARDAERVRAARRCLACGIAAVTEGLYCTGCERAPAAGAQEPEHANLCGRLNALLDRMGGFGRLEAHESTALREAITVLSRAPAPLHSTPLAWRVDVPGEPHVLLDVAPHDPWQRPRGWDGCTLTPLFAPAPAPQVAEPSGVEREAPPGPVSYVGPAVSAQGVVLEDYVYVRLERIELINDYLRRVNAAPAANPGVTHWDGCWREHHACAVAIIERGERTMESACVSCGHSMDLHDANGCMYPPDAAQGEQDGEDEAWLAGEFAEIRREALMRIPRILARLREQAAELDRLRGNCDALLAAGRDATPATDTP